MAHPNLWLDLALAPSLTRPKISVCVAKARSYDIVGLLFF